LEKQAGELLIVPEKMWGKGLKEEKRTELLTEKGKTKVLPEKKSSGISNFD